MRKKISTRYKPLFLLILEPKPLSRSNVKGKHSLGRHKTQWLDMGTIKEHYPYNTFIHKSHYSSQVALVVKNPPANARDARDARDTGLIPGWEDSLEYEIAPHSSILAEHSMGRAAWWATVHGATKNQTWLSDWAPYNSQAHPMACNGESKISIMSVTL